MYGCQRRPLILHELLMSFAVWMSSTIRRVSEYISEAYHTPYRVALQPHCHVS